MGYVIGELWFLINWCSLCARGNAIQEHVLRIPANFSFVVQFISHFIFVILNRLSPEKSLKSQNSVSKPSILLSVQKIANSRFAYSSMCILRDLIQSLKDKWCTRCVCNAGASWHERVWYRLMLLVQVNSRFERKSTFLLD